MKSITITNQDSGDSFNLQRDRIEGSLIGALEGFEYPTVIEVIEDVANSGGAVYITSKFGRRRIGINGVITCDRLEERRNLSKACRQTGRMKLIEFTTLDDLDLQFEAEVVKLLNPYTLLEKPLLVELVAPDYRFYSQELHSFDTGETIVEGSTAIPTPIPIDLSGGENSNNVENVGTDVSDPIFTITGPGTNFTVRNNANLAQFELNLALVANDTVVIDVKNRTVVKNGTDNVFNDFTGDFWQLQPGDNIIGFIAESGSTDDTHLLIEYRDAYSGI